MILGMSLNTFTQLHVIISLMGIGAGVIVLAGMIEAKRVPKSTALFLATTIATSVTGFMFPFKSFGPPEIVGVISLVLLAIAMAALYSFKLVGSWRSIYVVTAVFALYLNVFVAVVQTFQKVPYFHALAPTQTEPPFKIAQAIVLLVFVGLGAAAVKRFYLLPMPSEGIT